MLSTQLFNLLSIQGNNVSFSDCLQQTFAPKLMSTELLIRYEQDRVLLLDPINENFIHGCSDWDFFCDVVKKVVLFLLLIIWF